LWTVAADARLDLVNVSGGASKDFIVDANATARRSSTTTTTAISSADRQRLDTRAHHHRRRPDGRHCTAVTQRPLHRRDRVERIHPAWLGSGVCVGDYDNDEAPDV
jgi:hypothetical protein